MYKYTYTIFDSDPNAGPATPWPYHENRKLFAESDISATRLVERVMHVQSGCLIPADGYKVGQCIYATVWNADGITVGEPTYIITAADLT